MASSIPMNFGVPSFPDDIIVPCSESFPDAFFAEEVEDANGNILGSVYKYEHEAKAICSECPVRLECLKHALKYKEQGIWGGTTERERTNIKRLRIDPETHVVTSRRTGRNR